jgi:hypothetical protein
MRLPASARINVNCSHDGYFVDLFVRVSNTLAINMYKKFGYAEYRRVLGYYSGEEDAFGEWRPRGAPGRKAAGLLKPTRALFAAPRNRHEEGVTAGPRQALRRPARTLRGALGRPGLLAGWARGSFCYCNIKLAGESMWDVGTNIGL